MASLSLLVSSMSVDASGNIYILDSYLSRVTKWTPYATTGILVAGGSNYVDYYYGYYGDYYSYYYSYYYAYYDDPTIGPAGMFVEPQTMVVWLADAVNSQINKWTNPVTRVFVCGSYGSGANQFMNPRGLFVDTNAGNTLYVADTGNHRIQMWSPGATRGITVAGITSYYGNALNQLWSPQTLVVDMNSNMFIVDTVNDRIMKWTIGASSGVVIAGSITSGTATNQLFKPKSIGFDSNGSLVVDDFRNSRIQKFAISCRKLYLFPPIPLLCVSCIVQQQRQTHQLQPVHR